MFKKEMNVFALAVLILAVVFSEGALVREKGRAQIILISVDTLRADHLTAYGYARDTSPQIKKLADESVLYEHA
jgi:glucan phosphoethanolaminetransferase (alkaline phosphatase superfamily)